MRDLQKIVGFFFVITGLAAWFICTRAAVTVMDMAGARDLALSPTPFTLSDAIGLVCGAATWLILRGSTRVKQWCLDVTAELRKVVWPSVAETRLSTLVVIVMVVVATIILGLFDWLWASATSLIYR